MSEITENPTTNGAHDDFDWSIDRRNVSTYSEDDRKKFDELYVPTLVTIENDTIVKGIVVGVTRNDVVLNVGFKSDGLVPISEFRDVDEIKEGDVYEVYVVNKEDNKGTLVLSRKNAKMMKAWEQIKDAHTNGVVVTGKVVSKTKGGLIANVFGMETFLPGSQIDMKPITDYDSYVGKTMDLKVVKINEAIKNAVVSHKALIESDIEQQRDEIISRLQKGQVLEGVIKNITDFGAFIDLGGIDGLLYITDISWGRIGHPNEVLQLNQKINVVVLEYDETKKRISLGLKQLQPHPWDTLDKVIEIGSKVNGRVVHVEDYGAFLEVTPGVEGLVHISEVSWISAPLNSKDVFRVGETHEAVVMTIDREERKMSLSIKRLTEDPWKNVTDKFPVGSRHKGTVKNLTPYGVFVELNEFFGGMVHISELSWMKRLNHPSEYTKVGNELEVVILEVDKENRKLVLGHKQIEENPWETLESVFPVGSIHEATVLHADEKGAVVLLPYGFEGYAPKRHIQMENGSTVQNDQKLPFKVLEFNANDKRILVSHTRVWEEVKNEQRDTEKKEKKAEGDRTRKAVKDIQKNVEKSTLGDLGVLGELKEKMEANTSANPSVEPSNQETPSSEESTANSSEDQQ